MGMMATKDVQTMHTSWDFKTTVTEEELVREPVKQKLSHVVIQHTVDRTYQVLIQRVKHKQWAALATRRAPHYPRQHMSLPRLIGRLAKRFPYLREVTVEDLNPAVYTVAINPTAKRTQA